MKPFPIALVLFAALSTGANLWCAYDRERLVQRATDAEAHAADEHWRESQGRDFIVWKANELDDCRKRVDHLQERVENQDAIVRACVDSAIQRLGDKRGTSLPR